MSIRSLPDWSKALPEDREIYALFMEYTSAEEVRCFSKGTNLTTIVDYAKSIFSNLGLINPIQENAWLAFRWKQRQIFFLKLRIERAIRYKRKYYTSCLCGKIVRAILEKYGKWNEGNTPSIQYAQQWLDSI